MFTIAINLTLIEITGLLLGAIILGVTIYFFLQSRKTLQEAIESHGLDSFTKRRKKIKEELARTENPIRSIHQTTNHISKSRAELQEQLIELKQRNTAATSLEKTTFKKEQHPKEELTETLKETIAQQQKILNGIIKQVEEIENEGREELTIENEELKSEVEKLENILDKRNGEIEEYKKRIATAEKMAVRIDEVYQEFEHLQAKMVNMERQANKANNLAIELEDTKQSFEQLYKDLARKQEKLEEMVSENQRMRNQLETLEDKLAEANLQRQQLQKKVQFLQELNTDMQSMSETNKKLQTELRRIGELESMLTMMSEERDYLLMRKKGDK